MNFIPMTIGLPGNDNNITNASYLNNATQEKSQGKPQEKHQKVLFG
jgi:hypothetical protein